jgi:hypothetical protein
MEVATARPPEWSGIPLYENGANASGGIAPRRPKPKAGYGLQPDPFYNVDTAEPDDEDNETDSMSEEESERAFWQQVETTRDMLAALVAAYQRRREAAGTSEISD